MRKYDVFISYHRKSGAGFARMLQQALARKGYRCFLDVDAVQDGEFQEKILGALRSAPNFLFVLTDGALERIADPNDHIRIELEEAIRQKRKIVVAAPRGCRGGFCNVKLPDSLAELSCIQVTLLDVDVFFDKSVEMLEERFPKRKSHLRTRTVLGMLSGILVLLALTCYLLCYVQREKRLGVREDGDKREIEDQSVVIAKKMNAIRLPVISFKPPATIVDAVKFFNSAAKDYDNPRIPVEKRGFNFVLKTPQGTIKFQGPYEVGDFSVDDVGFVGSNDLSPIPKTTAFDITFNAALKLVCESVDYDFQIRGADVVVKPMSMTLDDMFVSFYKVKDVFFEMYCSWISDDMKHLPNEWIPEDEDPIKEYYLKKFFEDLGVGWPMCSSVRYLLSVGELKVVNTRDNHKIIEQILRQRGYLEGEPR